MNSLGASDIEAAREELLRFFLGFSHAGLALTERDLEGEVAEMTGMDRPQRPVGSIQLWIVDESSGQEVGDAARQVGPHEVELAIVHKQLKIRRPERRRLGFGSALLDASEAAYRRAGIQTILLEAQGDGSLFAATRGFDFDLARYAKRPRYRGLPEADLPVAAVRDMMVRPGIHETELGDNAPQRESVADLLRRTESADEEAREAVGEFRLHLPDKTLKTEAEPFTSPAQIAAFDEGRKLDALGGNSLGREFLRCTGWAAIKRLS